MAVVEDSSDALRPPRARPALGWLSWLIGLVLLGAVLVIALRFAEARELIEIAERAQPAWLAVAFALQGATYLAQGEVVRSVALADGFALRLATVYRLSLLFCATPTARSRAARASSRARRPGSSRSSCSMRPPSGC
jgi:hypothetical protein